MPEIIKDTITPKLKKAFCKTFDLPIKVYQEPYFTDRLQLFDPFFDTITKYRLFDSELPEEVSPEQVENRYMTEYQDLQDLLIKQVTARPGFQKFNTQDMSAFAITHKDMPGKTIYKPSNHKRVFISLDMRQANFQALSHYDPDIFEHADCWEDYIRLYTDKIHWIKSKHIRQVVMGHCNPKRQVTYERYLMDGVLTRLFDFGIDPDTVAFFSNDEIVLDITDTDCDPVDCIQHLRYRLQKPKTLFNEKKYPILRIQAFVLYHIEGTNGYYKLPIDDNETKDKNICDLDTPDLAGITFKGLSYYEYPFVLLKILKQTPRKTDRVFYHEGRLAQFLENITIKI